MRSISVQVAAFVAWIGVTGLGQAPHVIHSGDGFVAGDFLGMGVGGLPDVDNDGTRDFIVGAPQHVAANNTSQGGIAYVISGATWAVLYTFQGPANGAMLGRAFGSPGDVDGDGRPDIMVIAPMTTPPLPTGPGPFIPAVFVYSGATGSLIHQKPLGGQSSLSQSQASPLGDFDLDGRADFITGGGDAGNSATIYSGATGLVLRAHTGPITGEAYGYSVLGLGDIDGDSIPDYGVGARLADGPAGTDTGAFYVYSGATGGLLTVNYGDAPSDFLGVSAGRIGDVNGDGISDYAVGATGSDGGGTDSGMIRVFSGATRLPLYSIFGEVTTEALGRLVKSAGDVNGDGVPDIVAAVPGHDVPNTNCGAAFVYDGTTGQELGRITGFAQDDLMGYSVDGAGDADNDGFDDIIVGAPRTDPPAVGSNTGTYYVVSFGAFLQSCAAGNAGANILTINGSSGGKPRRVDVALSQTLTFSVAPTPNHTGVPFLGFGAAGVPGPADVYGVFPQIGTLCFTPSVLAPTQPNLFLFADSFSPSNPAAVIPGATPAPWSFTVPGGIPFPLQAALQFVVHDGAFRVSNAVLLDVH